MLQRLRENCLLRLKTINSIYYANYRRFIQNYSKVATPLTGLTSTLQPFCSNKAETAFICPKPPFTSASILVRPDINLQLIVKVEASGSLDDMLRTLGCCACIAGVATLVGGISSVVRWSGLTSRPSFPPQRQVAEPSTGRVGALPWVFQFYPYLSTWSRYVNPDSLSHQVSPDPSSTDPSSILPPSCIVGAASGLVEEMVRWAQLADPGPAETPHNRLFVPKSAQSDVLLLGHSSMLTCHLGLFRTFRILQQQFWWPSTQQNTRSFVAACPDCACGKSLNSPPAGVLNPLPIPCHPWSHFYGFFMGLPPSKGNATILTVVDCFSKAVY